MAGSPPNLHTMDSRSACIQDVLKVKVKFKGHVIRALLCWHENRFFSLSNCSIATKLVVDGLQESGPNFGFAYLGGTVIRRHPAIVPLDTQLASSYCIRTFCLDTFSLIRTVFPQFMRYRQTDDRQT